MASVMLSAADDVQITGGAPTALTFTTPGPFRSIVVHMVSGTAPVSIKFNTDGGTLAAATVYTDGGQVVLYDGLRARELPIPGGHNGKDAKFSCFSSANAVVYIELVR